MLRAVPLTAFAFRKLASGFALVEQAAGTRYFVARATRSPRSDRNVVVAADHLELRVLDLGDGVGRAVVLLASPSFENLWYGRYLRRAAPRARRGCRLIEVCRDRPGRRRSRRRRCRDRGPSRHVRDVLGPSRRRLSPIGSTLGHRIPASSAQPVAATEGQGPEKSGGEGSRAHISPQGRCRG